MNILRLTQHPASAKQLEELARIFGDYLNVIDINVNITKSYMVEDYINKHKASVIEVVLPLPLLAEVLNMVTIPVIRAVMNRTVNPDPFQPVTFEFDHYERIRRVVVETERL